MLETWARRGNPRAQLSQPGGGETPSLWPGGRARGNEPLLETKRQERRPWGGRPQTNGTEQSTPGTITHPEIPRCAWLAETGEGAQGPTWRLERDTAPSRARLAFSSHPLQEHLQQLLIFPVLAPLSPEREVPISESEDPGRTPLCPWSFVEMSSWNSGEGSERAALERNLPLPRSLPCRARHGSQSTAVSSGLERRAGAQTQLSPVLYLLILPAGNRKTPSGGS